MTDDINKGFDRNAIIVLCAPGFGESRFFAGHTNGISRYIDDIGSIEDMIRIGTSSLPQPIVIIDSGNHEPHNPFAMHDIVAKHMEIMFDPKNQPGEIPEVILDDGFMVDRGKNTALKHVKRDWELRDRRGKKR